MKDVWIQGTIRLLDSDFDNYEDHLDWFKERGYKYYTARKLALEQVVQDTLGHTGFSVDEAEILSAN